MYGNKDLCLLNVSTHKLWISTFFASNVRAAFAFVISNILSIRNFHIQYVAVCFYVCVLLRDPTIWQFYGNSSKLRFGCFVQGLHENVPHSLLIDKSKKIKTAATAAAVAAITTMTTQNESMKLIDIVSNLYRFDVAIWHICKIFAYSNVETRFTLQDVKFNIKGAVESLFWMTALCLGAKLWCFSTTILQFNCH